MKIDQIVPHISNEASGPSHSVPALCESLIDLKQDVTLHVLGSNPGIYKRAKVRCYPYIRVVKQFGFSPSMYRGISSSISNIDILHNHSLWMAPNIYPYYLLRKNKHCKLVVSPRGTMSDYSWNRSRWKKGISSFLGQMKMLERVDCFHATAESEAEDIRRLGYRQPIALIKNGVKIPSQLPHGLTGGGKIVLFLARVHPTKGVDLLLQAWRNVHRVSPNDKLVIAGPDNLHGYLDSMKKLANDLQLRNVEFTGAVYGKVKEDLYRASNLYVLPTLSENFGISVAEALSYGVPTIVTKGAPWDGLKEEGAGWWVDIDVQSLEAAMLEALSLPDERLSSMGHKGRLWMQRDFSWDCIAEKMLATYEWLQNQASPTPGWVIKD